MKSKTLFYLILIIFLASLIPAMRAQTFSVLHSFTEGPDGTVPDAGVTIRGNALYGTTTGFSQSYNCGAVYQLTRSGSNWLFSTLASFSGTHFCWPLARVVFGPDGHLYGTTQGGGMSGYGTVFKLTPPVGLCKTAACYWTVTELHGFGSGTDGLLPGYGDLTWDQQGNIYGTTSDGGTSRRGTVYELTPSGNGYTESFLYSFSGPDGATPYAGLVFDNKGNLFGTTAYGGTNDEGTVYELSYVPGVGWTEHVIRDFQNASDGAYPIGGLTFDSAGNLYGTTAGGGNGDAGTVFELSPSGDTWIYKVLYRFSGPKYCGSWAALSMDGAGNLYGTTYCGGIYNQGSVFKLSNTQNGWLYTSLHDFTGGTDGGGGAPTEVWSNVAIDTDGTLYGTTPAGGDMNRCSGYGCGVVWMIKP